MDEPTIAFDAMRLIFGDAPALFYAEIIVRTLVIYAYTLVLLRWLGGRTVGQLSTVEFLLVIALGSAVGDPMFYPEVPLFHALLVITLIVLLDKGLDYLVARTTKGEKLINGKPAEVVRDGVVNTNTLRDAVLGRDEFFRQLRREGIINLGQVHLAYLETNGELSVVRQDPPEIGLPIVPPLELTMSSCRISGSRIRSATRLACRSCGKVLRFDTPATIPPCPHCHYTHFSEAQPPTVPPH